VNNDFSNGKPHVTQEPDSELESLGRFKSSEARARSLQNLRPFDGKGARIRNDVWTCP
jgi:hypothetical protein